MVCFVLQVKFIGMLFYIVVGNAIQYIVLQGLHLIERDCGNVVAEWNTHRIRPSSNSSPPGHPDELFSMPQLIGMLFYICNVNS